MTILDKIIKTNAKALCDAKAALPTEEWPELLAKSRLLPVKNFSMCLKRPDRLAVIAELKKASPSKGVMRDNFEPVSIARDYVANGADALSVLTEPTFFLGAAKYLEAAHAAVNIPILRKDFLVDPWQVYESRKMGADAVLLIVALHDNKSLRKLLETVRELKMYALVEVHDCDEAKRAADCGAEIIGINNRNLKTFKVDITTTERVIREIPRECLKVSESGISTFEDIDYIDKLGVNAALIGEAFMREKSPGAALDRLINRKVER